MYFVHIATLSDADDFVSFLDGKKKLAFNDSNEFIDWVNKQSVFPLEIYLDGVTYQFLNKQELDFFQLGFEAALNSLRNKYGN